jgi:hypothetical protein
MLDFPSLNSTLFLRYLARVQAIRTDWRSPMQEFGHRFHAFRTVVALGGAIRVRLHKTRRAAQLG